MNICISNHNIYFYHSVITTISNFLKEKPRSLLFMNDISRSFFKIILLNIMAYINGRVTKNEVSPSSDAFSKSLILTSRPLGICSLGPSFNGEEMESNVFKDFSFQGSHICVFIYAINFQSCFNFFILIDAVSKFLREGGNEVINLSFDFGDVRESSSGKSVEERSNKIKDLNINFIWGTCIHGIWIG